MKETDLTDEGMSVESEMVAEWVGAKRNVDR